MKYRSMLKNKNVSDRSYLHNFLNQSVFKEKIKMKVSLFHGRSLYMYTTVSNHVSAMIVLGYIKLENSRATKIFPKCFMFFLLIHPILSIFFFSLYHRKKSINGRAVVAYT